MVKKEKVNKRSNGNLDIHYMREDGTRVLLNNVRMDGSEETSFHILDGSNPVAGMFVEGDRYLIRMSDPTGGVGVAIPHHMAGAIIEAAVEQGMIERPEDPLYREQ